MNINNISTAFKYKDYSDPNFDWSNKELYNKLDLTNYEFIDFFKDKLLWYRLDDRSKEFSKEFIERYKDKVTWYWILIEKQFSEEELEKFWKQIHLHFYNVLRFQKLSLNFLKKHFDMFEYGYLAELKRNKKIDKKVLKEFIKWRKNIIYK